MSTHLLSSHRTRTRPTIPLAPGLDLAQARVHEACGSARHGFALWLASRLQGPVLWIAPGWQAEQPHPQGMWDFTDPARFLFVTPRRGEDLLWCMEETLRAGAVPLVVADLQDAPALTPVRRLHLAAETGGGLTGQPPLGLLLTPDGGGAQGVESRWHMTGCHEGRQRRWRLERRRARTEPVKAWIATQSAPRQAVHLTHTPVDHD